MKQFLEYSSPCASMSAYLTSVLHSGVQIVYGNHAGHQYCVSVLFSAPLLAHCMPGAEMSFFIWLFLQVFKLHK